MKSRSHNIRSKQNDHHPKTAFVLFCITVAFDLYILIGAISSMITEYPKNFGWNVLLLIVLVCMMVGFFFFDESIKTMVSDAFSLFKKSKESRNHSKYLN